MARCGRSCPYHWHDEDCEYCSARGDEVIDLKNYSYDTCPYYQEYQAQRGLQKTGSSSGGENSGCGCGLLLLIIIAAVFFLFTRSCTDGRTDSTNHAEQVEDSAGETADASDAQNSGFVFPNSSTELIEQQEAENLSDRDLIYAINEIYARHGYIFQSTEIREYYEQFSWYTGEVSSGDFSVDCFNQTERDNWALLVKERDSRKAG